jgi:predicted nucleic acid-binding protein
MSRYLLDSSAVIDLLRGRSETVDALRELIARGDILCTCDVVVAEVATGMRPLERPATLGFLGSLAFLDAGFDAACEAGTWRSEHRARGVTLSTQDCLIAATARRHDATLVTGNLKHYPQPELRAVSVEKLP